MQGFRGLLAAVGLPFADVLIQEVVSFTALVAGSRMLFQGPYGAHHTDNVLVVHLGAPVTR